MRILITGGAGYVGSHVCKALASGGHLPIVYDNLTRGHRAAARWGALETGDLADRARLRDVIARHRPDGVMHLAAFAYVGESVARPDLYYANNLIGTFSLLEAMREFRLQVLVFSSSCAVYGTPAQLPLREDHPQAPINPYGASKQMAERMLRDYDAAYGLRSVSLRYFNAAGADPAGEIGEMHDPETHAIPLAIAAALRRESAFPIYGTDYPTADGSAVRDYVHVADLADAHIAALDYLLAGGATTALNLGTGIGTSVLQIVAAVERASGRKLPVVRRPRRAGDPPVLLADPSRARAVLGWQPNFRNIDDIVRTAWDWHCGQGKAAVRAAG